MVRKSVVFTLSSQIFKDKLAQPLFCLFPVFAVTVYNHSHDITCLFFKNTSLLWASVLGWLHQIQRTTLKIATKTKNFSTQCSMRCVIVHMHAQAYTQVSLHVQSIAWVKSWYFHFFFQLLLHISRKEKFFIKEFFIEHYIQKI